MLPADVALALLVNRTTQAFTQNPPTYMTYRERSHITVPSLGRSQDIDRTIAVRVADDYAVMHDLPQGARRVGQAFPVLAYFDPLSAFGFTYYANLKLVRIQVTQGQLWQFPIPAADPSVDVVLPYNTYFACSYAPDSTDARLHIVSQPTSLMHGFYPSDVLEDPQTQLPSRIEMRDTESDMVMSFDFGIVNGHWMMTDGTFTQTQHVGMMTFQVVAQTTFDDFAFPLEPPDPQLAGSPSPSPSPT